MKKLIGAFAFFSLGINACTTEGEGSEFITKLASREEANEIVADLNVAGALGAGSIALSGFSTIIYMDTTDVRNKIAAFEYDASLGDYVRSDWTLDSVNFDAEYYRFSPRNSLGFPSSSPVSLTYKQIHGTYDEAEERRDSLVIVVNNLPVWSSDINNESLNGQIVWRRYSETYYTDFINTIDGDSKMTFSATGIHSGTVTGTGTLKMSRFGDQNYNISTRSKVIQNSLSDYTQFVDFGGYGYKRSNYESAWTPYELDF